MEHEKIITREDGSKVKIGVSLFLPSTREHEYRVNIALCGKGKRTWVYKDCTDDYDYRYKLKFASPERIDYEHKFHLQFATEDEIHQAKLELWEKMKP
jgi:hypothetical protein